MAVIPAAQAQTDVWGGGFPSDQESVGSNWVGGTVPASITAGTDTLVFNDSSDPNMKLNVAGTSLYGIQVTDTYGDGNNAKIYGSNTLTIGSGGITQIESGDGSISTYISVPIALSANQTWTAGNDGYLQVAGAISGAFALQLNGGYYQTFEFDSGSSTFTGGVTLSGSGSILAVGATGTPFGTGPLSLGDGTSLQPTTSAAIALPNAVSFGDGSGNGTVSIGGNPYADFPITTSVTFNGNATFNENTTGVMDSEVDLSANTTVTFAGTLSGGSPGVCIDFGTVDYGANTQVIVQGNFGTYLNRLDLEDNVSVILDGSSASAQIASIASNISDIGTGPNSYLGLGKDYVGNVASFLALSQINQSGFEGTLGFDTTSGATANFTDSIDLTNFNLDSGLVGIGSATKAIISGTITPPGGLGLEAGTVYPFGGGGGMLQVTSPLTDSSWNSGDGFENESNAVYVSPGNGPLTLVLSGALSYSGGTYVDGGALVFDTTFPSGNIYLGERTDIPGYVGATVNAGSFVTSSPQTFISLVDNESSGVVGFDFYAPNSALTISGPIDLSSFPDVYLGTATQVTYSGTITPYNGTFQFSGVKGGQVIVTSPSLTGATTNVVIGLPTPIESYGSVSSVVLPNDNLYGGTGDGNGGTTLNSGYLYVGTPNSIGSGNLTVTGPGDDGTGTTIGLAPYQANVTLSNSISIPYEGLHLNYSGSPYTLTLAGTISDTDYDGSLIIDGPVTLTGNNTFAGSVFVNGTNLTLGSDQALWYASLVHANSGSTVVFNSQNPYVSELELTNSTAAFTYANGDPEIDYLTMAQGSQITFAAGSTPFIYGMGSDAPGSGNVVTLGAGTALVLDLGEDPDFHGNLVGPASSSIELESGTLNLSGSSTAFSGTLTVDSYSALIASNATSPLGTGPVIVNGTLATNTGAVVANPITLNDGATLAGFGTFSPGSNLTFQNGSTLIPGSTTLVGETGPSSIPVVGTLTFGGSTSLTFGQNGNYYFGITDANGAAGVGYSTVNVSGGLTISSSSESRFNIYLYSFAPGDNTPLSTSAVNFNPLNSYSWTLVTTTSGITGFNASDFFVNPIGFLNPIGIGSFFVSESGNDLTLNFTPVPEPSTWALMASGICALGAALRLRHRSKTARAASGLR